MKVKDGAEADGYTVLELADKVLAQHIEVIFVLADKIFGRFLREAVIYVLAEFVR